MRNYKIGVARDRVALLPASVEDYIAADNPIRAIDCYVESLDLTALGFRHSQSNESAKGQPAFAPADLLKLYLWGYLNRIRSSRKLAHECHRNLELM